MNRPLPPPPDSGRAVDRALGELLRRLDPATDPRVLRGAELASLAVARGHAALDLQRPQLLLDAVEPPQDWADALAASAWVACPEPDAVAPADRPLVLEHGLLYLRRYREYERGLAAGLHRLAAFRTAPVDAALSPALEVLFARLFPHANADADGGQSRAARAALARSLLLVTGGPGTGKTTTIARVLALLAAAAIDQQQPLPRIALAAPTGRAADRMAQSLRLASERMRAEGIAPELCAALPLQARTLHRLLGAIPGSPRFRHDRDQPLAYDVIVVDEASMVDLPMMCKLVDAVPDGARLILLGDPDQLPSVEAGDVLAAIAAAAVAVAPNAEHAGAHASAPGRGPATHAPARRDDVQRDLFDTGPRPVTPPPAAAPDPPTSTGTPKPARVHLTRGFRQSSALELAPLADAVRAGDADRALSLLHSRTLGGVQFHADALDPLATPTRAALLDHWRGLAHAGDPAAALAQVDRARVLTALREGAQGAVLLNARIEEALAGAQRERYFPGRLLLVTENSYRHGLFNGDIGVCLRDADGAMVAWFAGGGEAATRAFHPAALPAHDSAFAMTVHKAQGSEYDTVWLQLPRQDARTLSRELIYTALTRARQSLHVAGGDAVLRTALGRHAQRVSGLARRLR